MQICNWKWFSYALHRNSGRSRVSSFYAEKNQNRSVNPYGLEFYSQSVNSTPISLGAQIEGTFVLEDGTEITPIIRAAYTRAYQTTRDKTVDFVAAPGFTWLQRETDAPTNITENNARLTVRPSKFTVIYYDLMSQLSDRYNSFSGNFGAKIEF